MIVMVVVVAMMQQQSGRACRNKTSERKQETQQRLEQDDDGEEEDRHLHCVTYFGKKKIIYLFCPMNDGDCLAVVSPENSTANQMHVHSPVSLTLLIEKY